MSPSYNEALHFHWFSFTLLHLALGGAFIMYVIAQAFEQFRGQSRDLSGSGTEDFTLNRSSRRKRGMASNPLFIIPDFFLHFPNELCYGYLRFEGNGKIPLGM